MSYQRKSLHHLFPRYDNNSVMQLIIVLGTGFIMAKFATVLFIVFGRRGSEAYDIVNSLLGLPQIDLLRERWWTIFSNFFFHTGFFHWLTNMIWLFVFGSALQRYIGRYEIKLIYFFSAFVGGLCYLGSQLLPLDNVPNSLLSLMGSDAGTFGFIGAILALSPLYKLRLGSNLIIPIWFLAGLYAMLVSIHYNFEMNIYFWLVGGLICGFIYGLAIKNGYALGKKLFGASNKIADYVTPNELPKFETNIARQKAIDDILEKINRSGVRSLSKVEKQILEQEGQRLIE